jgi:hypothetical protein
MCTKPSCPLRFTSPRWGSDKGVQVRMSFPLSIELFIKQINAVDYIGLILSQSIQRHIYHWVTVLSSSALKERPTRVSHTCKWYAKVRIDSSSGPMA